jgi:hypothetical protein
METTVSPKHRHQFTQLHTRRHVPQENKLKFSQYLRTSTYTAITYSDTRGFKHVLNSFVACDKANAGKGVTSHASKCNPERRFGFSLNMYQSVAN